MTRTHMEDLLLLARRGLAVSAERMKTDEIIDAGSALAAGESYLRVLAAVDARGAAPAVPADGA